MRARLLLLVALLAAPSSADQLDLRGIWQPLPNPALPQRARVLTKLGPPAQEAPQDAPSVVLITVDTWRADRLGLYGSPRPTSPFLEELARSSVVFDRALAPAPWTWPTMVSLSSGLSARAHGAVLPRSSLCEEATTLAETFYDAGFRTGFAGSNSYFEPSDNGYRQGFEYYYASGQALGPQVLEYAGYFLDGLQDEPFFLHVHLFDPHCPYDPEPEDLDAVRATHWGPPANPEGPAGTLNTELRKKLACHGVPPPPPDLGEEELAKQWSPSRDRQLYYDHYDAELLETDRYLAQAKELLGERWDSSWVVITGDHGEEFEEHGLVGHGYQVYGESTWVPLLVRPPGGTEGRRVQTPVSLLDVAPTLAAGVGLQPSTTWQGADLGPVVGGEAAPDRAVLSETVYGLQDPQALVAWRDLRFVKRGSPLARGELFADGGSDATDLHDGAEPLDRVRAAAMASRMHRALERAGAGTVCEAGRIAADPAHWERLRELGYVDEHE